MPAVSEKQRRFMMADLDRAKKGEKTKTGMSESQLKDYGHVEKRHIHGGSMHDHVFFDNGRADDVREPAGMFRPYDTVDYAGKEGSPACPYEQGINAQTKDEAREWPHASPLYNGDSGKVSQERRSGVGAEFESHATDISRSNAASGDPKSRNYPGDPGSDSGHVELGNPAHNQ